MTNQDSKFEIMVYFYDTDTFLIEVDRNGYETVHQFFGGFDCLTCICSPLEIVLQAQRPNMSDS